MKVLIFLKYSYVPENRDEILNEEFRISSFLTYSYLSGIFLFSRKPGPEGGDGGGGDGGRISGHVQARYSITPRDQISRSGNPLTSIYASFRKIIIINIII